MRAAQRQLLLDWEANGRAWLLHRSLCGRARPRHHDITVAVSRNGRG
jgi:hypothetical protein